MADTLSQGPLVFIHLQKTGGSTVHHLLTRHLPESHFAKRDRVGRLLPIAPEELRDQIISGHVTAHFVKQLGAGARVITVLREPVERLLSHFYFLKGYTRKHLETYNNPLLMRIKEMNLHTFLHDPEIVVWFKDFYLKHLDPDHDPSAPTSSQPDVQRALTFLQSCEIVGVMPQLLGFVQAVFRNLRLAPVRELPFVNRRRDLELMKGFEPVTEEAPSPEDIEQLETLTRNDRILFNYAAAVAPSANS